MKLVIQRSYVDAKHLVQNLTASEFADDVEVLGFCGDSMEAMEPVCQNRRKEMTPLEATTYVSFPWKWSLILDHIWPLDAGLVL